MTGELAVVAVIVAVAALYLVRSAWRTWAGGKKAGCGGNCGCGAKTAATPGAAGNVTLIPLDQIGLRRR
jgi:hypothetical protein